MEGPALKKAGIVPDLVDRVDEEAAVTMHIRYGGRDVGNGNEIMPSEARLCSTWFCCASVSIFFHSALTTDQQAVCALLLIRSRRVMIGGTVGCKASQFKTLAEALCLLG